jgi:hypothetical protein
MAYQKVYVAVQGVVEVVVEVDDGLSRREQYLQAFSLGAEAAERGQGTTDPQSYRYTPTRVCDATEEEALRWRASRDGRRRSARAGKLNPPQ